MQRRGRHPRAFDGHKSRPSCPLFTGCLALPPPDNRVRGSAALFPAVLYCLARRHRMPLPPIAPAVRGWAATLALCAGALFLAAPALAATDREDEADDAPPVPVAPAQPVLVPSPDGALVIDTQARLAWPRCAQGMQWTGTTCTGVALRYTYGEAQALVRQRWKDEGVRWRLPRVPELRRLVNRNAQPPSVDPQLFPNAPLEWHWTGTASVNTLSVNPYAYGNVARGGAGESSLSVQQGWAVDMTSGEARGDVGRSTRLPIRLVRPAP
ncbi:uncharacterized protein DUF1566 [Diaphorobacter nitroreducens]|uniref:Uncharacterized protein DUF1566 n=4 Tax=Comamonadaceae TaxID=80864 RepID=A0AAX1WVA3_9BURK|nr:uncharacterized protein DUF1566 [Diaphorobacter nitroreducens]